MCFCCPTPPAPPGNPGAVLSGAQCVHSVSEIRIIDEVGLGLPNTAIECDFNDGAGFVSATTDQEGRVCLSKPIGTQVTVRVQDVHETKAGEAQTTPSGTHFRWRV